MIIPNVDRYRVWDPLFEGLRVILSHHGESYSPAYVQGLSGRPFASAASAPARPCTSAMEPQQLAALLGYDAEWVPFEGQTVEAPGGARHDDAAPRR